MATTLTRARWQSAQWLRAIGLPGWTGLALGLACAIAAVGLTEPLRADAQRLGTDSDLLAQRAVAGALSTATADATPQQQLAAFEQRFAGDRAIAPSLAQLQAAAQRRGFVLDQAEFKLASDPSEPLARYAIVLPIKADYRALRRFTHDALQQMPGLALDEVNLRRSDPKSPLLEAQLRFVLFLTKPLTKSLIKPAAPSTTVSAVGLVRVAAATAN